MSFEFDFNVMFKAAAGYIARGFRVVRLHGFHPDGRCTCGNPDCAVGKHAERTAGKHPVGDNWGTKYARSEDDLLAWDDGIPFNIGLVLGPGSGVIDNEDDSPEGREFRAALGMAKLVTPTWGSGRGTHQLTAWDERLSGCKAVEKPGGLEVRIGAGSAATQSVLPPSWHWSGVRYQWLDGLSPDDVAVAPTPKELLAACTTGRSQKTVSIEPPASVMLFGEVGEGGRHRAVLRWTWFKVCNLRNPTSSGNRDMVAREVMMANTANCRPPLDDVEVRKIVHDCMAHYRRLHEGGWRPNADGTTIEEADKEAASIGTTAEGIKAVEVCGFELHGLRRIQVGSVEAYDPGDWSVTIVHGDPPQLILHVPQWDDTPCRGRIYLSYDDFLLPNKVAGAIFKATRKVIINADASKWFGVWRGIDASKKTGGVAIEGLSAKLMAQLRGGEIWVGTSGLRYATLAGYLLDTLHRGQKPKADEEQRPLESGRPCWVKPGEVWFHWGWVWEEIASRHETSPGERTRIRDMLTQRMNAKDLPHKRYRFDSGRRNEYVVFTKPWIDAVQRLSAGSADSEEGYVENEAS